MCPLDRVDPSVALGFIPTAIVADCIEYVYGQIPSIVVPLPFCGVNQVFRISFDHETFIVRFARDGVGELLINRWCSSRVKDSGVPSAEVLYIHEGNRSCISFSVERYLPGFPACLLSRRELDLYDSNFVRDAAKALFLIHTIPTDGFGKIDSFGSGRTRTWAEWLSEGIDNSTRPSFDLDAPRIPLARTMQEAGELAYRLLDRSVNVDSAHLLHGDFTLNNLLVNNGRLSGVIDWGDAASGDPLFDLVRFEFFHGNRLFTKLFDLYDRTGTIGLVEELGEVLDCYRLWICIDTLLWRYLARQFSRLLHPFNIIKDILEKYGKW